MRQSVFCLSLATLISEGESGFGLSVIRNILNRNGDQPHVRGDLVVDTERVSNHLANNNDTSTTMSLWMKTKDDFNEQLRIVRENSNDWKVNTGDVNHETIGGKIYTLKFITQTKTSVIFLANFERTTRVVKIQDNCAAKKESCGSTCVMPESDLDPLLDEFLIMKTFGDLKNSPIPKAYALSRPSKVNEKAVKKLNLSEDGLRKCREAGASFRGILEERVGSDIKQYVENSSSSPSLTFFGDILLIGRRMIGALWRLHDLGYIHGDFHHGNGAFKFNKAEIYRPRSDEMLLIDFGFSRFIPSEYGTDVKQPISSKINQYLLSPWHLDGYRIGRRDDLYRVFETMARELWVRLSEEGAGLLVEKFAKMEKETGSSLAMIKRSANFFDVTNQSWFCCPSLLKALPGLNQVMEFLSRALATVHAIDHVDKRPPYEAIIRDIDRAIIRTACLNKVDAAAEMKEIRSVLKKLWDQDTTALRERQLRHTIEIDMSTNPLDRFIVGEGDADTETQCAD